jgi:hypothetical protein
VVRIAVGEVLHSTSYDRGAGVRCGPPLIHTYILIFMQSDHLRRAYFSCEQEVLTLLLLSTDAYQSNGIADAANIILCINNITVFLPTQEARRSVVG